MRVFSRDPINKYTNFLFSLLPQYFKDNDTNPILVNGQYEATFLERFYEAFCNEIDSELSPPLEIIPDLYNLVLPEYLDEFQKERYYDFLANFWGITSIRWIADLATWGKVIKNCSHIVKHRGTWEGLRRYLFLYNLEVKSYLTIELLFTNYDTTRSYDDGDIYDLGEPIFYTEYDMVIRPIVGDFTLDSIQLGNLKKIINTFFNPTYTKLRTLTKQST